VSGSVNKAILVGRLGKDPEVRYTSTSQPVCRFSVATDESWTDKATGHKQERTEWHNIVVWGRLGEICGEYLNKGSQAYIEGKIQTREWTGHDSKSNRTTEIVAREVVFLGAKPAGQKRETARAPQNQNDFPEPPEETDDIPF
jgi:single-strand DNA-binding protein